MNEELYNYFSEVLPEIDSLLAIQRMPLQDRPLRAVLYLCEYYLVSIDGEKKENIKDHFSTIWFGAYLRVVERWYCNKYGESFNAESKLKGVVFISNTPFLLEIPKTISTVNEEDNTFSYRFLSEVLETEQPLEWLVENIDISELSNSEKNKIINNIKKVATLTRSINMNLLADFPTKESTKMLKSVFTHIDNGVNNIVQGWFNEETIFIWEFHLAIEKSMKVYLQQRDIQYKKTHSLEKLNKAHKEIISFELLEKLPHHLVAISSRYNESPPLSEYKTMDLYINTLEAINNSMKKYHRKFNMGNATLIFKRPPWVDIKA